MRRRAALVVVLLLVSPAWAEVPAPSLHGLVGVALESGQLAGFIPVGARGSIALAVPVGLAEYQFGVSLLGGALLSPWTGFPYGLGSLSMEPGVQLNLTSYFAVAAALRCGLGLVGHTYDCPGCGARPSAVPFMLVALEVSPLILRLEPLSFRLFAALSLLYPFTSGLYSENLPLTGGLRVDFSFPRAKGPP